MFLNSTNDKFTRSKRKMILFTLIGNIIFNIILLSGLFISPLRDIYNGQVIDIFKISNGTLSIIAIGCSFMYYLTYNEEDIFIISQIYIIIGIEYFFGTFIFKNVDFGTSIGLGLIFLYRTFLITLIVYQNEIIIRIINNNKILTTFTTVILSILLIIVEKGIYGVGRYDLDLKVITFFSILLITYYFYFIIILAKKSIVTNQFIYTIFVASINIFIIRKIYQLFFSLYNKDTLLISMFLYFFGLLALVVGLFIEMFIKVKESENLKTDLKTFYDATENNKSSNVLIYDENYKIIYANKLYRDYECGEDLSIEEQYELLESTSYFNRYIEDAEAIKKNIDERGNYSGTFFMNIGKVYRSDMQKVLINDSNRIVATYTNITEEFLVNERLKVSESKLKSITENILDLIASIDKEGTITYLNRSALLTLGYEEIDIIGKSYIELLVDKNKEVANFLEKNIEESALIAHGLLTKDGEVLEVESVVRRLYKKNGFIDGYIVVARNLKMKKELDELRDRYNQIKEYDHIRGEFFANLSHEVRTPINIIYSCLQLLNNQKNNGAEELAAYYEKYEKTIKQNCFRILRMVNNLIDISKIDSGFENMKFNNYDIINLVEDITMSVIPYVEGQNISIMFDTDTEECNIKCDPDKIERVMLNLISNAVKFTDSGGSILVDIKVDDIWINIRIKDSGHGIPVYLREIIFERFVQTDKSFNRQREGSGIGLALVKSIVSLHNGEVYLEDSSDEGSVFIVKLPNIVAADNEAGIPENRETGKSSISDKVGIEFSDIYNI
ncbi:PAS domain-containing sensor histidine kinase [Clostridium paraputrificum]|uniref:sensor histidine kinase n=1 Tax=Clostridium TaxID=1485 RepID=UPI003D326C48